MEEKLAKFREQLLAQQSSHVAADSGSSLPEEPVTDIIKEEPAEACTVQQRRKPMVPIVVTDEPIVDETPAPWTTLQVATLVTKIALWCLLMALAVVVEFGAVFFAVSVLCFIFTNLRNRPRKRGELSAYSVFNPNGQAIDGSVSAQDFEQQLRYGALH